MRKKNVLCRENHAGHIGVFRHAVFGLRLQHNELLSKPALRGEHPVFRGDGLSGSIEASVAMHGVFLYAVFFNGFLAALGPGEALSRSFSLSFLLSSSLRNLPLSPPSSSPWRTSALFSLLAGVVSFPPRARPPRSLSLSSPLLPPPACYLGIAVLCSPFPRVSRKAKWSFCSAFTAGARGREAYNFLGVFIAG